LTATPEPQLALDNARVLLRLGDDITTDHISPAGAIPRDSVRAAAFSPSFPCSTVACSPKRRRRRSARRPEAARPRRCATVDRLAEIVIVDYRSHG
jgi:hypothetical protein